MHGQQYIKKKMFWSFKNALKLYEQ